MLYSYILFKFEKKLIMNIKTVSTCINCENLISNFICSKHNLNVGIYNVCESHTLKHSISKDSSCSNCSNFENENCTKPEQASNDLLCFDWQFKVA